MLQIGLHLTVTRKSNHYLKRRGERWHYHRRVPSKYGAIDTRGTIRIALDTDSVMVARERRDALMVADERFWREASQDAAGTADPVTRARERHRDAQKRAIARGFVFRPLEELAHTESVVGLVERIEAVEQAPDRKAEAEAVLGGALAPSVKISEALELYLSTLSVGEQKGKSPDQLRKWILPRRRAIKHFVALCGDLNMNEIERHHARCFYEWWADRLSPGDGSAGMKPNSANRDIGNLRKLFRVYWTYEGDEERRNPFRELRFSDGLQTPTPAFSDEWVRTKILHPVALKGIHPEAQLIVHALIETGCRPSEIANLEHDDIHLDTDVPYISVRPKPGRQLKTKSSQRDIPLVGVSLAAMKQAPDGFPHYRDRSAQLSANLMKAFRNRGLFEVDGQRIYSFRHSFEQRMLEAGIDYGLRCILMGHQNTRPTYGDGGSLKYRRTELAKIQHPILI